RRHTRSKRDWSSDVCSSDLPKVNRRPLRSCTDAWTSLEKERRPMTQETLTEPQSAQKQLTQDAAAAPRIPRRPQERTMHGDTAVIDHGWLRTLDPAAIAAHLDAERRVGKECRSRWAP